MFTENTADQQVTIMNSKSFFSKRAVVFAVAILCNSLWGSATPAIKTAYSMFQIGPGDIMSRLLLAGVRFAFAGAAIIVYSSISAKKLIRPKKESWFNIIKLGTVQTVIQYIFFYTGLAHTTGMKSLILGASATFFAIFFSVLYGFEKMTVRKITGCIIGFAGVVLINLTGDSIGAFNLKGDGAIMVYTVANAFAAVLIKKYSATEDPAVLTGYQFLYGGIVLAAAGLIGHGRLLPTGPAAWLLMAYMILLSAVAYTLWSVLLKYNPVSSITIYSFTSTVFGVLLSAIILKEKNTFTPLQCAVSVVLVSLGIIIVNLRLRKESEC